MGIGTAFIMSVIVVLWGIIDLCILEEIRMQKIMNEVEKHVENVEKN